MNMPFGKAIFRLFFFLCAVSQGISVIAQASTDNKNFPGVSAEERPAPKISCLVPYTGQVGTKFRVDCSIRNASEHLTLANVSPTSSMGNVIFEPKTITLDSNKTSIFSATVTDSSNGLVSIIVGDGDMANESLVDVGFKGRLTIAEMSPLDYDDWRTVQVIMLDRDGKPLSLGLSGISLELQSIDGKLKLPLQANHLFDACKEIEGDRSPRTSELSPFIKYSQLDKSEMGDGEAVLLPMCAGASASPPFKIKSTNRAGGTIHLNAKLHTGTGLIVSEASFTYKASPATWLPILLSILGASLYSLYKLFSSGTPLSIEACSTAAISSVLVGLIGWIFARMDILGLHLDPDTLRTYLVIGFGLSFLGVDKVLGKVLDKDKNSTSNTQQIASSGGAVDGDGQSHGSKISPGSISGNSVS